MPANVLILSRDPEVRTRLSDTVRGLGWKTLDFTDGASAFLCACGRVASLEAAVIDEAIGSQEAATLVRRLRLLRPDIRTFVLHRRPSGARAGAASADAVGPALEHMESDLRRARSCRPSDQTEGTRQAG